MIRIILYCMLGLAIGAVVGRILGGTAPGIVLGIVGLAIGGYRGIRARGESSAR